MTPDEIARLLTLAAADLEDRLYAGAPILRQGARTILDLQQRVRALERRQRPDSCAWCGAPIVQPATGRPRRWCSNACRRRSQRAETVPQATIRRTEGGTRE